MNKLVKRLPVVLIAVLGVWIWQGGAGLFPVDRELVWQLPGDLRNVRSVEIQLWDGAELLKREERSFPAGVQLDIVQSLPLKQGEYHAKVFVRREGARESEFLTHAVRLGREKTVVSSLR